MAPLWTSNEVITATNGINFSPSDWHANGVSIDTRTISPGNIFIAINGPKDWAVDKTKKYVRL